MVKETNLKELDIPYIGIKIDSIPTILKVLENCKNDSEFLSYYSQRGKTTKTASEYLRSLRNLSLAYYDNSKQTKLFSEVRDILNVNIENFYESLYKYLSKKFIDLKIIKNIISSNNNCTLPVLLALLADEGYTIKRKHTLSSYRKLFIESANKGKVLKAEKPSITDNEDIELKQLKSYLIRLCKDTNKNYFTFKELKILFKRDKVLLNETTKQHLYYLELSNFIHLFYFNPSIASEISDYVVINDKYCYKLEVLI